MLRCSNPSVSGVVCVCLGRREYVELLRVPILLFLGLCVFRSERIRRVVLRCSNPSVSGVVCV